MYIHLSNYAKYDYAKYAVQLIHNSLITHS